MPEDQTRIRLSGSDRLVVLLFFIGQLVALLVHGVTLWSTFTERLAIVETKVSAIEVQLQPRAAALPP